MGLVLPWTPLLSCLKVLEERKLYLVPGTYIRSLTHRGVSHIVGLTSICRVHHIRAPGGGFDIQNPFWLNKINIALSFGQKNKQNKKVQR